MRLFEAEDPAERAEWIDRIMEADDRFLAEHPDSTLFAYFAGTPNKSVLAETERLSRWAAEESGREQRAARAGGEYYDRGALSSALIALEDARQEQVRAAARVEALESQVAALRADPLYGAIGSVVDADADPAAQGEPPGRGRRAPDACRTAPGEPGPVAVRGRQVAAIERCRSYQT